MGTESDREDPDERRSSFVDRYCTANGWDARNLTWQQICEIRARPEWSSPPAIADKPETVVRRKGADLFVYEEGEFCCVCKSTDSLRRWGFGDPESPLEFTVCDPCHSGAAFKEWLAGEFERAMILNDEEMKLPDGRWTTAKYGFR